MALSRRTEQLSCTVDIRVSDGGRNECTGIHTGQQLDAHYAMTQPLCEPPVPTRSWSAKVVSTSSAETSVGRAGAMVNASMSVCVWCVEARDQEDWEAAEREACLRGRRCM